MFKSEDWWYIKRELEKKLDNARSIIEQKQTTPEDTAYYRGMIALTKELLKLPDTLTYLANENDK